ncbi:phospholipase A2 inhibitor and Ly6/PLAUR domain-containing protein-like [Limanda limanda]|uniref:phospholipase A2 inhibitor and Ly6/PLAUR domain-containing protein-like n=1 Tax=Limanda limanda TaxID=27771 RepID=UPI0029C84301|nr:phospholipase A2 inhibitor and Ly6/PLAUR domain-containing protein-like [Limanda limanda]
MMKLLLSLTLIWTLSSTGEALVCETCTDAACSTTVPVTCSTETMCITASIQVVTFGTPGQQIYKACAPPSLCPSTGSQIFSVNLGVSSALANAACCSTDSCNSNTLPFPVVPAVNSLQCHLCNPVTSDCSSSIQCRGTEDRCFQATVTNGAVTSPAFGCASTNQCAVAASLGSLAFMQDVDRITRPACCATSLCNSPTTTIPTTPTTATSAPTTPKTTTTTPTTPSPVSVPAGPAAVIYLQIKITTSDELSNGTIAEHVNQFLRTTLLNSTGFTVNVKSIQRVRVAP